MFLCDCLIAIVISVSYESVLVIVYLTFPVPQCRSVSTQILLISGWTLLILTIVYHLLTYLSTCQDINGNNSTLYTRFVRPIEETSMSMVQPYRDQNSSASISWKNVPYILRHVDTMSAIKGSNINIYPLPLQIWKYLPVWHSILCRDRKHQQMVPTLRAKPPNKCHFD